MVENSRATFYLLISTYDTKRPQGLASLQALGVRRRLSSLTTLTIFASIITDLTRPDIYFAKFVMNGYVRRAIIYMIEVTALI